LGRFKLTQHYNTNITVSVTGDTATATCSLLAVHVPDLAQLEQHADVGGRHRLGAPTDPSR
jgi:SnoaL-like domain